MISNSMLSFAIAIAMFALALFMYQKSQRDAFVEKVTRRMVESSGIEASVLKPERRYAWPWVEQLFWRAGIDAKSQQVLAGLLAMMMIVFLVGLWKGLAIALSTPIIIMLLIYLWLLHKAKKRIVLILAQLPLFLDQVLRGLGTGRSMEGALSLAADETPAPLKDIITRVLRAGKLGADLGEAIQEAADLYRINELYLLALSIRINRSYGSSVRDMLQNVAKMIHDREAARGELRALTGETRVTAWVLGLLPPSLAVYIMLMNPRYLETMWQDASGRILLMIAIGLQLAGAFTLWRMIKSI
ncbi:type II secretion system F family protein [Methylotuvimicrobium sp. KM1]|uniref:type II secretion system F family protein n=1 Tax=Methylotuvimicrobium sp. KM1 TaxID=3377707 RepID=UPI00384BE3CC